MLQQQKGVSPRAGPLSRILEGAVVSLKGELKGEKGLLPVKPAVFLKGELNLMSEQACSVTAAPAAAAGSS